MNLFYIPHLQPTDTICTMGADESHHAITTLRLRAGDTINITNGRGDLFCGRITEASKGGCAVEVLSVSGGMGRRNYFVHVAVCPTKNIDRYEWFLEKSTEVGIDRITPLLGQHSERKVVKHDRSSKVVMSAVKQSLKYYVPELDELTSVSDFVKQDFAPGLGKFIAFCSDEFEKVDLCDALGGYSGAVVMIGPEGDFSPKEVALALEHGFAPVSLGGSRLRTETAALVSVVTASLLLNKK